MIGMSSSGTNYTAYRVSKSYLSFRVPFASIIRVRNSRRQDVEELKIQKKFIREK